MSKETCLIIIEPQTQIPQLFGDGIQNNKMISVSLSTGKYLQLKPACIEKHHYCYINRHGRIVNSLGYPLPRDWNSARKILREFQSNSGKPCKEIVSYEIHEPTIVINSSMKNNYFHWWFDWVPQYYLAMDAKLPSKYLTIGQLILPFQTETLQKLPHLASNLTIVPLYRCGLLTGDVYIPSQSSGIVDKTETFNAYPIKCMERFRESFALSSKVYPKFIYISRNDSDMRRVINEDQLKPILEKYGFKIVIMSDYNLCEQIELFTNAKIIMGPHGAGFTNIGFTKVTSKVLLIELLSKSLWYYDCCFRQICYQKGIDHLFIDTKLVLKDYECSGHGMNMEITDFNIIDHLLNLIINQNFSVSDLKNPLCKCDHNTITKILYGISIEKSIDITGILCDHLSSLMSLDINKLVGYDPYINIAKKLYLFFSNGDMKILDEYDGKLTWNYI